MKKIMAILMALLVVFSFVSCSIDANDNGLVDYRVSTEREVARALVANDPGKDAVKNIVIKFTPVNQSNPVGASTGFEFGLINWDASDVNKNTNGTWVDTKHRFLSQGQWKIEAIGTTKTEGTVAEIDNETLYYGFVNVYISKAKASATIVMTPKAKANGTGVLKLGYAENGTVLPISSKAVVSDDPTKQRLTYKIYDVTGKQVQQTDGTFMGGTLMGKTFVKGIEGKDDTIEYETATVNALVQGSYIVAMTIDQFNGSAWVESTGGSAIDVGIYKDLKTNVWGTVSPSDYIHTSISTSMDIDGGIVLTITPSEDKKSFTASVTYKPGSDLTVDKYLWFVDGNLTVKTTGTFTLTFDTTDEQNGAGIHYGEHKIQCVAVDTNKKIKSNNQKFMIYYSKQGITIPYDFEAGKWV